MNLGGGVIITPYLEIGRTLLKVNASFRIGPGEGSNGYAYAL